MRAQKQDESFFAYWISFWPTAPFFGVAWRFEKMAPFAGFYAPSSVIAGMARASAAEAAKAAEEAVEAVEDAAEIVVEAAEVETAEVETAEVGSEAVEAAPSALDLGTPEAPAEAAPATEMEHAPEAAPTVEWPRPAGLLDQAPLLVDDLKLIKGVGPKLEQILNDLGVYTFAQIAAFGPDDCAWVEAQVAAARARPLPVDWAEQAREKA
jgi:predicted flap endonuclease-1-like 5' DNA nuclease